jgi:hypothetical protein
VPWGLLCWACRQAGTALEPCCCGACRQQRRTTHRAAGGGQAWANERGSAQWLLGRQASRQQLPCCRIPHSTSKHSTRQRRTKHSGSGKPTSSSQQPALTPLFHTQQASCTSRPVCFSCYECAHSRPERFVCGCECGSVCGCHVAQQRVTQGQPVPSKSRMLRPQAAAAAAHVSQRAQQEASAASAASAGHKHTPVLAVRRSGTAARQYMRPILQSACSPELSNQSVTRRDDTAATGVRTQQRVVVACWAAAGAASG